MVRVSRSTDITDIIVTRAVSAAAELLFLELTCLFTRKRLA